MTRSLAIEPIGGYLGLDTPRSTAIPYPQALKFQSARAALKALLAHGAPSRIWVPRYVCDSVLEAALSANVAIAYYSINTSFDIDEEIKLGKTEWLLYINYFGLCGNIAQTLLRRYPPNQIVMDHSQAFFSPPLSCLATIYSPRKFFGIPDGGLLATNLPVSEPIVHDLDSVNFIGHLVKRNALGPEAGYPDFQLAENRLSEMEPLRMSALTEVLFSGIEFDSVEKVRRENFLFLQQRLESLNGLKLPSENIKGPLCYPFFCEDQHIRQRLLEERIFVPKYWPEVMNRKGTSSTERRLTQYLLPLPVDQRYNSSHMERLATTLEYIINA
jgi:hypothetical protein